MCSDQGTLVSSVLGFVFGIKTNAWVTEIAEQGLRHYPLEGAGIGDGGSAALALRAVGSKEFLCLQKCRPLCGAIAHAVTNGVTHEGPASAYGLAKALAGENIIDLVAIHCVHRTTGRLVEEGLILTSTLAPEIWMGAMKMVLASTAIRSVLLWDITRESLVDIVGSGISIE